VSSSFLSGEEKQRKERKETEVTEFDFGIEGRVFSQMAVLGMLLATPPVGRKTTEEDGKVSVGMIFLFVVRQCSGRG
jgi:hypothetical protein